MPEAKFEIYKTKTGKFRFRLVATNGETIAIGESYESRDSCLNGVESVKRNASVAVIKDMTKAK